MSSLPGRPAPPSAESDDPALVEAALPRPWWKLRFSPALEARYLRHTRAWQALRMALGNLVGAASFFWITIDDAARMAGESPWLHVLRWPTIGVFIVAAAVAGRPRVAAGWAEAMCALGAIMAANYSALAAATAFDNLSLLGVGGVFLIFMSSGIALRQQFRWALGVSLYVLVAFAVAVTWRPPELDLLTRGQMTLFVSALLFTMTTNFALEHRERRNYLLRLLQRHRDRALEASAGALKHMALHDALTGLANRRQFDIEFSRAWAGAAERTEAIALVVVDIDWFKRYNDRYGHPEGDRCLRQVSAALQAVAERHGGTAGRLGGEEFGLLLPGLALPDAQTAAQAACSAVEGLQLAHPDSPWSRVTVSAGVASVQASALGGPAALMRAADECLYRAKEAGRNRSAGVALTPLQAALASAESATLGVREDKVDPELAEVDRLIKELDAPPWRLSFPADLESAYGQRDARRRGVWLCALGLAGIAIMIVYVWLSQPLFADVAAGVRARVPWLLGCGTTSLVLSTLLPLSRPWREALFTATTMSLGIGMAWLVVGSQLITVHTYMLGFFLFPMFCAVIAAQPLRLCLIPSIAFWAVVTGLFCPARGSDAWTAWAHAGGVSLNALVFSLFGGYLLDRSMRREYLLGRLHDTQRAVLQRHAAELQRLAETDPLSGMPNRRHFEAESTRLQQQCRSRGEPLALLLIDIDHFKRYNDGYGHGAGDACLVRVAAVLLQWAAESTARGAVAARIGGEEFGVLLPSHEVDAARTVADGLCRRIRALAIEHRHAPVPGCVTVSIGAASLIASRIDDGSRLMQLADEALYRAKRGGRDRASD